MNDQPKPLMVFNYPAGNESARAEQEANAAKIQGYQTVVCARHGDGWSAVELVQERTEKLTQELLMEHTDCLVVFRLRRGVTTRMLFAGIPDVSLHDAYVTFAHDDPETLLAFRGRRMPGGGAVYLVCTSDDAATKALRDAVRARRDQRGDAPVVVRESQQESSMTAALRFVCDQPDCNSTVELAFPADIRDPKRALEARSWRCESFKGRDVHLCPVHNSGANVRAIVGAKVSDTIHDE